MAPTNFSLLARGLAMIILIACASGEGDERTFAERRNRMVEEQIEARGVKDKLVLKAMRTVPRHEFVPKSHRYEAYSDWPVPIGYSQTISQPYIVAYMTEALALKKGDKVLEIGTGSGYQAAVLAQMGMVVYSIEIVEPLGNQAKETLTRLGYKVNLRIGDGYDGWPQAAPFDGIIVTAAPKSIPKPLKQQMAEGGRLVIPVGSGVQTLKVFSKEKGIPLLRQTLPVRFVPMTGKADR